MTLLIVNYTILPMVFARVKRIY